MLSVQRYPSCAIYAVYAVLSSPYYLCCVSLLRGRCYAFSPMLSLLSLICYLCSAVFAIFAMLSLLCYLCYVVFAMRSSLLILVFKAIFALEQGLSTGASREISNPSKSHHVVLVVLGVNASCLMLSLCRDSKALHSKGGVLKSTHCPIYSTAYTVWRR